MELSNRELSLIDRGYDKDLVESLCYVNESNMKYIEDIIYEDITMNVNKSSYPSVTYIGGQPGSGKSVVSMKLKRKTNAVMVGIDNYRMYHPNYLEMEKAIRNHWKDRIPSLNDTPGNDIADFTHTFSGKMTDRLIDRLKNDKYNILLEWSMRNPFQIINSVNDFKNNNYNINLNCLAVSKDISLEACHLRNSGMSKYSHIVRRIPDDFHEMCVNDLPNSINKIYEECNDKISRFNIVDRSGKILWSKGSKELPGVVLKNEINKNYKYDEIHNGVEWALLSYEVESIGLKVNKVLNIEQEERKLIS